VLLCIEVDQISFISCLNFILIAIILVLKVLIMFILSVCGLRDDFEFWYCNNGSNCLHFLILCEFCLIICTLARFVVFFRSANPARKQVIIEHCGFFPALRSVFHTRYRWGYQSMGD
jgi:hypothetical protein